MLAWAPYPSETSPARKGPVIPRPGADMMIAVVVVGSLVRLIDSGPEDYAALQPACRIARGQLPFHRRVIPPGTRIG